MLCEAGVHYAHDDYRPVDDELRFFGRFKVRATVPLDPRYNGGGGGTIDSYVWARNRCDILTLVNHWNRANWKYVLVS